MKIKQVATIILENKAIQEELHKLLRNKFIIEEERMSSIVRLNLFKKEKRSI